MVNLALVLSIIIFVSLGIIYYLVIKEVISFYKFKKAQRKTPVAQAIAIPYLY